MYTKIIEIISKYIKIDQIHNFLSKTKSFEQFLIFGYKKSADFFGLCFETNLSKKPHCGRGGGKKSRFFDHVIYGWPLKQLFLDLLTVITLDK